MIKLITGSKGTGKTKIIINMANDNVETSAVDERELIGFIRGILAGNHDIESFYIDGAHRMLARPVAEMEDFFTDIYNIAKHTDTRFILTVSENEENFPEFLKKYQAEE